MMQLYLVAGANLLPVGFEPNNVGGFLGWETDAHIIRLSERGPDGGVALRFSDNPGVWSFSHARRKLASGGRYRLSANVRTRNVTGANRVELMIHSWPWSFELKARIPSDTAGDWQPISCEGVLPVSRKDEYDVTLYCSGGLSAEAVLDIADLKLFALDEKAASGASPIPTYEPYVARICPVDPELADVDPRQAKMRFFYSGPKMSADGVVLSLRATLAGQTRFVSFTPEGYATVDFGEISAGRHSLVVETAASLTSPAAASNRYTVIARAPVENPTPLRRLNNFVSEILSVPLANGEQSFVLAKAGWVWIGTDRPFETVEADLDETFPRVVHYRPRELGSARFLEAGRHVVYVRGVSDGMKGRLVVRLMKPIIFGSSLSAAFCEDPWSRRYMHYFLNADYLERMNLFDVYNETFGGVKQSAYDDYVRDKLADRGVEKGWTVSMSATDPSRIRLDAVLDVYTNAPNYRAKVPFCIDEVSINALTRSKYNNAEAMWRVYEDGVRAHTFFEDSKHGLFNRPGLDIPESSAFANVGGGRSFMIHEWYARAPWDEAEFDAEIAFVRRQLAGLRFCVPSAPKHIVYYLNGYMLPGFWSSWVYPHVDMKAHDARLLHILATDPEFADIGGVGIGGARCEEDFLRAAFAMVRHYAVEGRTDDFAAVQGWKLFPGHLANGDFTDGFKGWKVVQAEPVSVTLGHQKKCGLKVQERRFHAYLHGNDAAGDDFAVLTRSAKGPNRLVQTLKGLTPGMLYQVNFATMGLDDLRRPQGGTTPPKASVYAHIAGAQVFDEMTHVGACYDEFKPRTTVHVHRYVFRAMGPTAELTLFDWTDETTPGGPAGESQLVNFVGCQRYFVRDELDFEFLKSYFGKSAK